MRLYCAFMSFGVCCGLRPLSPHPVGLSLAPRRYPSAAPQHITHKKTQIKDSKKMVFFYRPPPLSMLIMRTSLQRCAVQQPLNLRSTALHLVACSNHFFAQVRAEALILDLVFCCVFAEGVGSPQRLRGRRSLLRHTGANMGASPHVHWERFAPPYGKKKKRERYSHLAAASCSRMAAYCRTSLFKQDTHANEGESS